MDLHRNKFPVWSCLLTLFIQFCLFRIKRHSILLINFQYTGVENLLLAISYFKNKFKKTLQFTKIDRSSSELVFQSAVCFLIYFLISIFLFSFLLQLHCCFLVFSLLFCLHTCKYRSNYQGRKRGWTVCDNWMLFMDLNVVLTVLRNSLNLALQPLALSCILILFTPEGKVLSEVFGCSETPQPSPAASRNQKTQETQRPQLWGKDITEYVILLHICCHQFFTFSGVHCLLGLFSNWCPYRIPSCCSS